MLLNPKEDAAYRLAHALQARIQKDGRFRVNHLEVGSVKTSREDRRTLGKVWTMPAILMKGIRLTKKSSYCGAHAFPCPVGAPKKNATFLDWQNWIEFHQVVNSLLNQRHCSANIYTNPPETLDQGNRMWIRRGMQARVRWDVEGHMNNYGRMEEVWDHGTPSQFTKEDL
jgi:hypothetical protein